ncbi:MAG: hypothetical protein ACK6CU_05280 [Deltaproteobacteria bacterium]|jgi:hypothetical protein
MPRRWLELIGRRSGPELLVLISIPGALAFAFGGENVGTVSVLAGFAAVIGSRALARRQGVDAPRIERPGDSVCFACRQFPAGDLQRLSRYMALLGPATWAARQNFYCSPCARRQEVLAGLLGLAIIGMLGAVIGMAVMK